MEENDNEQNDVNLNNIRVSVFKGKKVIVITGKATKLTAKKLLTALTNVVLKKKEQDGQDISMKKIQIQTKINKSKIAANTTKPIIYWNLKKKQKKI